MTRFCQHCGAPHDEAARFCPSCGQSLVGEAQQQIVEPLGTVRSPEDTPAPRPRSRRLRIKGAALAALLVVAAASGAALALRGSDAAEVESSGVQRSTTTSTSTTLPLRKTDLSDTELVKQFGDAVWRVEAEGCGVASSGTAFAVDEHLLVTNHHVVATDPTPVLRDRKGAQIAGEVVGMSTSPDVAVIRVKEDLSPVLLWAKPSAMSEGDHLLGLGYPVPALDFTATPGSILSFQVNGGQREAIRTDGALDRGNSGGPALNRSGEVVGVVTEMASSDGFQNVPLLFTHDALRSAIASWADKTAVVKADCAVTEPPPLPDWYFEGEELPPVDVPEVDVPDYVPPTTTTVPCPSGRPSVAVTEFRAVEDDPEYMAGFYEITIRGTVTNNSTGEISVYAVDVAIDGGSSAMGFANTFALRPGQSTTWEATTYDQYAAEPSAGQATLDWDWASYEHYGCGTG